MPEATSWKPKNKKITFRFFSILIYSAEVSTFISVFVDPWRPTCVSCLSCVYFKNIIPKHLQNAIKHMNIRQAVFQNYYFISRRLIKVKSKSLKVLNKLTKVFTTAIFVHLCINNKLLVCSYVLLWLPYEKIKASQGGKSLVSQGWAGPNLPLGGYTF